MFKPQVLLSSLALLVVAAPSLFAQATTVQLPTFNATTVNTTVNIPDGGSVGLGGIDSVSEGRTERGVPILSKVPYLNRLFKNTGIGREVNSWRMRAHAKILIQEELEQEVMNQARASRAARGDRRTFEELLADHRAEEAARQRDMDARKAAYLSQFVQQQRGDQTYEFRYLRTQDHVEQAPDVDQIQRQIVAAKEQRDAELVEYFEEGKAAVVAGKHGAARVYFKMALRRAQGQFKVEIQEHLDSLD